MAFAPIDVSQTGSVSGERRRKNERNQAKYEIVELGTSSPQQNL
jgi:hypothetical protein